jgi:5'-3' exonuclease
MTQCGKSAVLHVVHFFPDEPTCSLWEPGYKERYYEQKFGVGPNDEEFRRE